jgi:hypothetical protein
MVAEIWNLSSALSGGAAQRGSGGRAKTENRPFSAQYASSPAGTPIALSFSTAHLGSGYRDEYSRSRPNFKPAAEPRSCRTAALYLIGSLSAYLLGPLLMKFGFVASCPPLPEFLNSRILIFFGKASHMNLQTRFGVFSITYKESTLPPAHPSRETGAK